MCIPTLRRLGQALLLVGLVAGGTAGLAVGPPTATAPVALASVAAQNDNDDDDDNATVLRGQVVSPAPGTLPAIDRSTDPPVMFVANIDGLVTVLVYDPAEFDTAGVLPGDHVRIDGQKVNEFLFVATDIEVTERCCPAPQAIDDDDENDGNGNANDNGDNGNANDNEDNDNANDNEDNENANDNEDNDNGNGDDNDNGNGNGD